jgi:hypothetical protein
MIFGEPFHKSPQVICGKVIGDYGKVIGDYGKRSGLTEKAKVKRYSLKGGVDGSLTF